MAEVFNGMRLEFVAQQGGENMKLTFKFGTWLSAILLLAALTAARAQDYDDFGNDSDDPPGRVARMNYTQGAVSFQPGGEGDWVQASPNRPLTSGDNLWTDRDSHAELHIGSTAIRLAPETSLTFLDLEDRVAQVRLTDGSTILNVRHLDDDDQVEVDTPDIAFRILQPGEYRIDVDSNGQQTYVTAFHGRGEVSGGGSSYTIVGGQRARFSGVDQLTYDVGLIPRDDDFTNWCQDRDQRESRLDSLNYVSPEMTGYEDLDDYGRWNYVSGYGPVWYPVNVANDWAPYRFGHWVFISPWGWTWVDDAPWGFAPFHYGRWAYLQSRWCWVPGPVVVRPVYAPALVVFVNGGWGGGPGVGWFPLGPGEVFVPGYRVSRRYAERVNVTNTVVNVTQVTNVYNVYRTRTTINQITYVNRNRPGAVTAVSQQTFVNARPIAGNMVRVSDNDIRQARIDRRVEAQPVRTSIVGPAAPAKVTPPPAVVNRQVVATRRPMPVGTAIRNNAPEVNIRTAAPANPRPLAPAGSDQAPHGTARQAWPPARAQQGSQPDVSPNQSVPPHSDTRPEQPANAQRPAVPRPPQRPDAVRDSRDSEPSRAAEPPAPPRPPNGRPDNAREESGRPDNARQDNARPDNRPDNGRPGNDRGPADWQNRNVRPVPAPRDKTPDQQRDEEQKFRNWQQQRQQAPPPQAQRPPEPQRPPQAQPRQPEPPRPQAQPQHQPDQRPQGQQKQGAPQGFHNGRPPGF